MGSGSDAQPEAPVTSSAAVSGEQGTAPELTEATQPSAAGAEATQPSAAGAEATQLPAVEQTTHTLSNLIGKEAVSELSRATSGRMNSFVGQISGDEAQCRLALMLLVVSDPKSSHEERRAVLSGCQKMGGAGSSSNRGVVLVALISRMWYDKAFSGKDSIKRFGEAEELLACYAGVQGPGVVFKFNMLVCKVISLIPAFRVWAKNRAQKLFLLEPPVRSISGRSFASNCEATVAEVIMGEKVPPPEVDGIGFVQAVGESLGLMTAKTVEEQAVYEKVAEQEGGGSEAAATESVQAEAAKEDSAATAKVTTEVQTEPSSKLPVTTETETQTQTQIEQDTQTDPWPVSEHTKRRKGIMRGLKARFFGDKGSTPSSAHMLGESEGSELLREVENAIWKGKSLVGEAPKNIPVFTRAVGAVGSSTPTKSELRNYLAAKRLDKWVKEEATPLEARLREKINRRDGDDSRDYLRVCDRLSKLRGEALEGCKAYKKAKSFPFLDKVVPLTIACGASEINRRCEDLAGKVTALREQETLDDRGRQNLDNWQNEHLTYLKQLRRTLCALSVVRGGSPEDLVYSAPVAGDPAACVYRMNIGSIEQSVQNDIEGLVRKQRGAWSAERVDQNILDNCTSGVMEVKSTCNIDGVTYVRTVRRGVTATRGANVTATNHQASLQPETPNDPRSYRVEALSPELTGVLENFIGDPLIAATVESTAVLRDAKACRVFPSKGLGPPV